MATYTLTVNVKSKKIAVTTATAVDHWVATVASTDGGGITDGPNILPPGLTSLPLSAFGGLPAGAYSLTLQAEDVNFTAIGSPMVQAFVLPPPATLEVEVPHLATIYAESSTS
jgi:hypothetical protein